MSNEQVKRRNEEVARLRRVWDNDSPTTGCVDAVYEGTTEEIRNAAYLLDCECVAEEFADELDTTPADAEWMRENNIPFDGDGEGVIVQFKEAPMGYLNPTRGQVRTLLRLMNSDK